MSWTTKSYARRANRAGFTLAEALAALMFMSVVIPVTMQGLRVANRASVVSQRKLTAMQLAENQLNQLIAMDEWRNSTAFGNFEEPYRQYSWRLDNQAWDQDAMRLLLVTVTFVAQGETYEVHLSTLVDDSQ